MKRHILIIGLLLITSNNLYSQIDYDKIRSYKLNPITIDTINEDVLIINKRYANVYFRQSNVKEYIKPFNKLGVRIDTNHDSLISLLEENRSKIILTDWRYDYSDSDRQRLFGNINYSNSDEKYISDFYYIGADLIHDGKFMVIEKKTSKVITKGLKIKRVKGLYGTRYVEFRLPSGESFWNVITRFGE